ncbi:MAG: hypothetical protein ACTH9L_04320 [Microbacterium gubbeenense]
MELFGVHEVPPAEGHPIGDALARGHVREQLARHRVLGRGEHRTDLQVLVRLVDEQAVPTGQNRVEAARERDRLRAAIDADDLDVGQPPSGGSDDLPRDREREHRAADDHADGQRRGGSEDFEKACSVGRGAPGSPQHTISLV